MTDEQVFEHESYAVIQVSQPRGGIGRLFGSAIPNHDHAIRFEVRRAKRLHSLDRDRVSSVGGDRIVTFEMSPAQFAEMVTTGMGLGEGIPCTLRSVAGKSIDRPPSNEPTEIHVIQDHVGKSLNELAHALRQKAQILQNIVDKKTLNKEDRASITHIFAKAIQDLEQNIPFTVEQLHKAAHRIVHTAKIEIETALHQARLRSNELPPAESVTPQLPANSE